jgi:methylated-DNA-[protein]-cysteine S-methyltransferase
MSDIWTVMESPVGEMVIRSDGTAITEIAFSPFETPAEGRSDDAPILADARAQLSRYFAGELTEFDLPLRPSGTEFQRRVWAALTAIPFGTTASYGQIAAQIGMSPSASRAVGLANGRNPIAIVVPCHRVVGANGKLVGYAGGLDRKRHLLQLEDAALV